MKFKTNTAIVRAFLEQNIENSFNRNSSIFVRGNEFCSYRQAIAIKFPDKGKVIIVETNSNLCSTTQKHICLLVNQAISCGYRVFRLPLYRAYYTNCVEIMVDTFLWRINNYYTKSIRAYKHKQFYGELNRKAVRDLTDFIRIFNYSGPPVNVRPVPYVRILNNEIINITLFKYITGFKIGDLVKIDNKIGRITRLYNNDLKMEIVSKDSEYYGSTREAVLLKR